MTCGNVAGKYYLLQHSNWFCIRTCNAVIHLGDALIIPPIIGVQGKAYLSSTMKWQPESVGLLLARAYAIADHKRLVLAVLGILGVCSIGPELVCAHGHFCNWHLWWTPVTDTNGFGQLCTYQCTTPNCHNVSSHTVKWTIAQWSIRGKQVKVRFIMTLLTGTFSR